MLALYGVILVLTSLLWISLAWNVYKVIDAWLCLFPPLPFQSVLPTGLSNTARVSLAPGIQPVNKPMCLCQDPNSTRTNQPVGNTSPLTSVTDQCQATLLDYWSKDTCVPVTGTRFESFFTLEQKQVIKINKTPPLICDITQPADHHIQMGRCQLAYRSTYHMGPWTRGKLRTH